MLTGRAFQAQSSISLGFRSNRLAQVSGFLPPIVTPLRDGEVDNESLIRQLDYLADHVAGYLIGGSLGEVASLTIEERETLMRSCAEHVAGERRLAVSISDNCLETSRRLAGVAGEIDADLVVASCPNYFVNDRDMLIAYFGALAEFAPTDICLYDNPIASGTQLSVEDITAIHQAVPTVSHIKVTDLGDRQGRRDQGGHRPRYLLR